MTRRLPDAHGALTEDALPEALRAGRQRAERSCSVLASAGRRTDRTVRAGARARGASAARARRRRAQCLRRRLRARCLSSRSGRRQRCSRRTPASSAACWEVDSATVGRPAVAMRARGRASERGDRRAEGRRHDRGRARPGGRVASAPATRRRWRPPAPETCSPASSAPTLRRGWMRSRPPARPSTSMRPRHGWPRRSAGRRASSRAM